MEESALEFGDLGSGRKTGEKREERGKKALGF
jgi:hypothetical protein